MTALSEKVSDFGFPSWMQAKVFNYTSRPEIIPSGYRVGSSGTGFDINGRFNPNKSDTLSWFFSLGVSVDNDKPDLIVVSNGTEAFLDAWLRELDPVVTTAFSLRIDSWAQRVVEEFACSIAKAIASNVLE